LSNLDQAEARRLLDASSGTTPYTNPTAPVRIRLCTTTGTPTTNGTPVSGGSYADQTVVFVAASAANPPVNSNSGALNFVNMPAVNVTSVEEWDSAGTPVRRWFGALVAAKTTNAGDTFTIAAGSLTKNLG
jgi:hypothetical protein